MLEDIDWGSVTSELAKTLNQLPEEQRQQLLEVLVTYDKANMHRWAGVCVWGGGRQQQLPCFARGPRTGGWMGGTADMHKWGEWEGGIWQACISVWRGEGHGRHVQIGGRGGEGMAGVYK